MKLYAFASRQSILSILFEGVKQLGEHGVKPPFDVLMKWIASVEQIEGQNKLLNKNVVALAAEFKKDGYDCCLLKGQGNNLLYPNFYLRTPGDIDLWITPTDKSLLESKRNKQVLKYIRKKYPSGFLHYNHIDGGFYNGTEIEVHHRPRFMNNMIHNARMQKWIAFKREEQFSNYVRLPGTDADIAIPTWDFNVIFLLAHIFGHVLQSGIGLRHIIDYYYLLISNKRGKKEDVYETIRYLGLLKIAGAVMWVLHEVFGLAPCYLIAPIDELRGKQLLTEIQKGGNFGYYDNANIKANTQLKKNWQRIKRDVRMVRFYPSECLWEPIFRLYHYLWRVRYKLC